MAEFLLDADIDPALSSILVGLGHDVLTTNQASRHDAKDDEQLLLATELGRTLITHDQGDYELLARAWHSYSKKWGVDPGPHAGVLVIPQHRILPYSRAVSEISTLLHSEQDLRGHYCTYAMKWGWEVQRF